MSEAKLWKDMNRAIGHRGHFSRVESHETSSGIPDLDFCINEFEGHIELKYGKNATPKIRSTQVRWFRDRVAAGGKPWLFTRIDLRDGPLHLLHRGAQVSELYKTRSIDEWALISHWSWEEMDWNHFIEIITDGKN